MNFYDVRTVEAKTLFVRTVEAKTLFVRTVEAYNNNNNSNDLCPNERSYTVVCHVVLFMIMGIPS